MYQGIRASAASAVMLLGAALCNTTHAQTEPTWDVPSLDAAVRPMQHQLNGFMPLLPASLPIPIDASVANVPLQQYAQDLWARGIIVPVIMDGTSLTAGATTIGRTLSALNLPVHVFAYMYGDTSSAPPSFRHNAATAFWPLNATPNPWAWDGGDYWPAFPLATPTAGYNMMKGLLGTLRNAGTYPSGLWMDYEDYPSDWADQKASVSQRTYFSQYYSNTYAAGNGVLISNYPTDLLTNDTYDSQNPMRKYSYDLHYALLKQSAVKAMQDVYYPLPYTVTPPIFGNYGSYYSSANIPFDEGWGGFPPTPPPEAGIVSMPVAYADDAYMSGDFTSTTTNPTNIQPTQATVDANYWYHMMWPVSTSQANAGAVGRSVIWVSYNVPDIKTQPWVGWSTMTPSIYKELLRHCWLRGVSGMYVFNRNPPDQPTQNSYNDLEFARSVLDEMLSFRQFLTQGVPMNYAVNSSRFSGAVEWSGMSNSATNPTQWVVRTVSLSGVPGVVPSITPALGLVFANVPAPPDGATFILGADGSIHRVDPRPPSLYLHFENNYQDSSGNTLTAVPGHTPGTSFSDPTFGEVIPGPIPGVLNGAYGLYANQSNRYSIGLSYSASTGAGDFVSVPNTNGVFNAASFTVEAFVDVGWDLPDGRGILSKGSGDYPGGYDWQLQYRSTGQLTLLLQLSNGTTYSLTSSTANLVASGQWYHMALTYSDVGGPTVTLYLDHTKLDWTSSSDGVLTGALPSPMARNTGDNLVIGAFGTHYIQADIDEVRFTPEVLEPLQMLALGTLQ